MQVFRFTLLLAAISTAAAQTPAQAVPSWQMQDSGTTASLRGIDSVNGTIAWASGTAGTVLRTTDGGAHWQKCSVPDAAADGATLDFRGVQGWDAKTAMVMSSGPGEKSRLYETTDGCKSWELLFVNPDAPGGFFDSFWLNGPRGLLLGDPVGGKFALFKTSNGGKTWKRDPLLGLALNGRSLAAFAASNSAIARGNREFARGFVTGGKDGAVFYSRVDDPDDDEPTALITKLVRKKPVWKTAPIAIASGNESAGAFAIAYRYPVMTGICEECTFSENARFMAVGGDYTKPNESAGTAAWSADGGEHWTAPAKMPHGYRSAVQWSETLRAWITVGTNGSDISRDDGKTWAALDNGNWNALSLPFAVGPNGRIARLSPAALPAKPGDRTNGLRK
jgi:photosystem II stability/assembly factor-like uncharacterized protein